MVNADLAAKVFIVIAAYNESTSVIPVIKSLQDSGFKNIVVVDDGSSDDTYSVLKSIKGIHVLQHLINRGQGAALQTGQSYALQQGAEYIVHFDADGQHPHAQIVDMLAPLIEGRADITIGSRFLTPESRAEVPFTKRLTLAGGTWLHWFAYGLKLSDAHNGFRAMTANAARKIVITYDRFEHASEIIDLISLHSLRLIEIPVTITYGNHQERTVQARGGLIFRPRSLRVATTIFIEKLIKIYT